MNPSVRSTRFGPPAALLLALAAAGCGSRGIHCSCFVTPPYRLPSGYSETYRDHLYARGGQPVKPLLNPGLLELPPPVPFAPPPAMTPKEMPPMDGMPPKERLPFPPAPTPEPSGKAGGLKTP